MCHVFVRGDSLAAVAVSDHDYPPRVAHTMLTRYIKLKPCHCEIIMSRGLSSQFFAHISESESNHECLSLNKTNLGNVKVT